MTTERQENESAASNAAGTDLAMEVDLLRQAARIADGDIPAYFCPADCLMVKAIVDLARAQDTALRRLEGRVAALLIAKGWPTNGPEIRKPVEEAMEVIARAEALSK